MAQGTQHWLKYTDGKGNFCVSQMPSSFFSWECCRSLWLYKAIACCYSSMKYGWNCKSTKSTNWWIPNGTAIWIIPVSEELIAFIASLSHEGKVSMSCVSVMDRLYRNFQNFQKSWETEHAQTVALFSQLMHKSLGTRLDLSESLNDQLAWLSEKLLLNLYTNNWCQLQVNNSTILFVS